MSRELYLHEVVDIVGQQAYTYMEESVLGFHTDTAADRGLRLFGTWEVVGATGRWPQVVNIWELVDGWAGWERLCRATNLGRRANAELEEWWREAYQRRSGGFDRLLGAAPGSPSLASLREAGIQGEWFVHELSRVRPGTALDYLAAVRDERAPVLAEYGHHLVGLWEVWGTDTEVCVLWATSLEAHVRLANAEDLARGLSVATAADVVDERLRVWRERRSGLGVTWREELLVPCPGSPLAAR